MSGVHAGIDHAATLLADTALVYAAIALTARTWTAWHRAMRSLVPLSLIAFGARAHRMEPALGRHCALPSGALPARAGLRGRMPDSIGKPRGWGPRSRLRLHRCRVGRRASAGSRRPRHLHVSCMHIVASRACVRWAQCSRLC